MKIYKADTINPLLEDTQISNIFLELYLPHLSGDSVRVYLFAWLCAQRGRIFSNEGIAERLEMDVGRVISAWTELEKDTLVRKIYPNEHNQLDFDIVFTDLKGSMFAPESKDARKKALHQGVPISASTAELDDKSIRDLFLEIEKIIGTPFPSGDYQKVAALLREYDVLPELVARAYKYCMDLGRNPSASYVKEVLKTWTGKGIKTAAEADSHIEITDMRAEIYGKIMRLLGLYPSSLTDVEKKVFDVWLDDYAMSLDDIAAVAEKAAGMGGKYAYVKKVIESERGEAGRAGSAGRAGRGASAAPTAQATDRRRHYAEVRRKNEEAAAARRKEVTCAVPRVLEAEAEVARLNVELATLALSTAENKNAEAARLSAKINAIIENMQSEIEAAGFTKDYMEPKYDCPLCSDTGIMENGTSCRCYMPPTKSETN